jgi:translation initiation factor SUI1
MEEGFSTVNNASKVHIRMQQISTSRRITTVSGLHEEYNVKKISAKLASHLNTSSTVKVDDKDNRRVIQLAGDQREQVRDFLIDQDLCDLDQIVIHGC